MSLERPQMGHTWALQHHYVCLSAMAGDPSLAMTDGSRPSSDAKCP